MSTPRRAIHQPGEEVPILALVVGNAVAFSGKLSYVTVNSEDNPLPVPGSEPAAPTSPEAMRPGVTTVPCEIGGREGPEPTRFGDWELRGRCIDF